MILVDTSIWIDHLHQSEPTLVGLLDETQVGIHPMVVGEITLGSIRDRALVLALVLGLLSALPSLSVASQDEVLALVESHRLFGQGLSLVGAHLLASTLLTLEARIWTRDRRLRTAAEQLGVSAEVEV